MLKILDSEEFNAINKIYDDYKENIKELTKNRIVDMDSVFELYKSALQYYCFLCDEIKKAYT
ncbi:hypothetical protein C4O88_00250 [Pasteurellaceae bacterium 12591]|nr:hypothetical protein C4O88_00250 [Pasteurellaceae bacterium 12591]